MAITLLLLAPFEINTDVVEKYKVPVICMVAPPLNVALKADVIDLSWKNRIPRYGPDVCADRLTIAPLEIETEP